MNIKRDAITAVATAAVLATVLLLSPAGCSRGEKDKDGRSALKTGSATSEAGTSNTVVLSEEVQKTGGIATKVLEPELHREQIEAYGMVLQPDGLLRSRNDYVSAMSSLRKAEASLRASKEEYRRLKYLNENDKNISDRMVQAAQARMEADLATEAEARENMRSVKSAAELQWGSTLSGWIFDFSPGLERLVGLKDVLVQVTIRPGTAVGSIPGKIGIEAPEGRPIEATLIVRAPATDPRIQGISYIYIAPSHTNRLIPGMNVSAYLPAAGHEKGFVIPSSAVVWLQGKAWVYIRYGKTGFSRVEVPTSNPLSIGYFVSGVFSPGDQLVIKGAQALLSEESKPKAAAGGEEEDED